MIEATGWHRPWTPKRRSMGRMVFFSALFHAGVFVVILGISHKWVPARFVPQVYHVDLVNLPRPQAPSPAPVRSVQPPPPVPKRPTPVKKVEILKPPPVKQAPRPAPPEKGPKKPVETVGAVPPSADSRKESSPKSDETAAPSAAAKPSDELASIPPPQTRVEAEIDAPNFKYPYYLDLIQRKIGMYWSPPPMDASGRAQEVMLEFVLGSNGRITEVRVEKSSGNLFFDQAALRAVYQANPLPPLPQGFSENFLKIHFSFSLEQKG